jgi:hypothetical protein
MNATVIKYLHCPLQAAQLGKGCPGCGKNRAAAEAEHAPLLLIMQQ